MESSDKITIKNLLSLALIKQQKIQLFWIFANQNTTYQFYDKYNEMAFLLLKGNCSFNVDNETYHFERKSEFYDAGSCLSVAKNHKVSLTLTKDSEVLLSKKLNYTNFGIKAYYPKDVATVFFGNALWNNAANRIVRTYFDYSNAPFSKLVVGEVINYSGNWTSYLPHNHPQPETYYFRFDKPQGFGIQVIENSAKKVKHHSVIGIPPYKYHPNVGAPGYIMYYVWIIPHLKDHIWKKTREFQPEHTWLLDPNIKIENPH